MRSFFIFLFLLFFNIPFSLGKTMNPIYPGAIPSTRSPHFGEAKKISMPSGREIYLISVPPDPSVKPRGIILYFHGNGEQVEDLGYLLPFFKKAALHAFFVEYPGYGHAPGKPSEHELYLTSLAAYDWAKKQYPTSPILVMGWSLGSTVAAYLAREREVSHLFLLSAMTSMKAVVQRLYPMIPDFLLKGNEFDVTGFINKLRASVTLIHGEKDDLVPVEMAKELKTLLGNKGRLIAIPGIGHNDLYLRSAHVIEEELLRIVSQLPY